MKKETIETKRSVILKWVVLPTVVFSLLGCGAIYIISQYATDSANGETDDEVVVHLEPITEDATYQIMLNLTGNATVIPTYHHEEWYGESNKYYKYSNGYFVDSDDLLDHFDKVYIGYTCIDEDVNRTGYRGNESQRVHYHNNTFRFFLFAYDNGAMFSAFLGDSIIENTLDDGLTDFSYEVNGQVVIVTIHYPKIIGWEDP